MQSDDKDLEKVDWGSLSITLKEMGIIMIGNDILISWRKARNPNEVKIWIRAPTSVRVRRLEQIDAEKH